MVSLRLPPTRMPATPSSHPLITWPAPSLKRKGRLLSRLESNLVPSTSQPVECTCTASPALASVPAPILRSVYLSPLGVTISLAALSLLGSMALPASLATAVAESAPDPLDTLPASSRIARMPREMFSKVMGRSPCQYDADGILRQRPSGSVLDVPPLSRPLGEAAAPPVASRGTPAGRVRSSQPPPFCTGTLAQREGKWEGNQDTARQARLPRLITAATGLIP